MKFSFFNFLTKGSLLLVSFLLFLSLTSVVSALGASPPFIYADYSDNFDDTFSFMLINNNPDPNIEIELTLKGDLAEYASLSEDSFNFETKTHNFYVTFNFPAYEELGLYGKQKLRIRASEIGKKNGMFTVGTAVEVWIEVYIPVPGSFAEVSSVAVNNAFEGEDTDLKFVLTNRGTEPISDSSARVYIKDFSGKTLETLSYPNIDIPYDDSITINDDLLTSSYDSGMYSATVEYNFNPDFAPSKRSATFFLGSSDIIFTNYTNTLVEGQINKVVITAQSLWGSLLDDVLFSLSYSGKSQNLPYLDFSPFQQLRFETFIEAPLIEDEDADSMPFSAVMDISIPNGDGTYTDKSIPMSFTIVKQKSGSSFSLSSTTILVIIGVLLLLAVVLLNVFILSKSKKNKK